MWPTRSDIGKHRDTTGVLKPRPASGDVSSLAFGPANAACGRPRNAPSRQRPTATASAITAPGRRVVAGRSAASNIAVSEWLDRPTAFTGSYPRSVTRLRNAAAGGDCHTLDAERPATRSQCPIILHGDRGPISIESDSISVGRSMVRGYAATLGCNGRHRGRRSVSSSSNTSLGAPAVRAPW